MINKFGNYRNRTNTKAYEFHLFDTNSYSKSSTDNIISECTKYLNSECIKVKKKEPNCESLKSYFN